jgi:hypothetical protein
MGCCLFFCDSGEEEDTCHGSEIKRGIKILKNDIRVKNCEITYLKKKLSKLENMYENTSGKNIRCY